MVPNSSAVLTKVHNEENQQEICRFLTQNLSTNKLIIPSQIGWLAPTNKAVTYFVLTFSLWIVVAGAIHAGDTEACYEQY